MKFLTIFVMLFSVTIVFGVTSQLKQKWKELSCEFTPPGGVQKESDVIKVIDLSMHTLNSKERYGTFLMTYNKKDSFHHSKLKALKNIIQSYAILNKSNLVLYYARIAYDVCKKTTPSNFKYMDCNMYLDINRWAKNFTKISQKQIQWIRSNKYHSKKEKSLKKDRSKKNQKKWLKMCADQVLDTRLSHTKRRVDINNNSSDQ